MARKSTDLLVATHPDWVHTVLADFDAFLQDHANCERKASALAMSMVIKHPDRTRIVPALIALAQEELEHFRQVYELMVARGLPLVKDTQDPYVNQLAACMRHGREPRFLDRLLISSLIECRGAERFRLIAEALEDPDLQATWRCSTPTPRPRWPASGSSPSGRRRSSRAWNGGLPCTDGTGPPHRWAAFTPTTH
jgi:tRNA-(ms[2]io[6]A)-hydroxylase